MNQSRKIRQILAVFLLPLVMWLFFNQIAYRHYHLLDNGIVVEHAHPFKNNMQKDTPYQKHTHTDAEFFFLAQISASTFLLVFFFAFLGLLRPDSQLILSFFRPVHFYQITLSSNRLRGPPQL